ncbi:MAG TPA: hypothetical protein VIF57_03360 [Polyangia bacterium]
MTDIGFGYDVSSVKNIGVSTVTSTQGRSRGGDGAFRHVSLSIHRLELLGGNIGLSTDCHELPGRNDGVRDGGNCADDRGVRD